MAKTKTRKKKALLTSVVRAGSAALPRRVKKRKKAVKKKAVKKLSTSRLAVGDLERRAKKASAKNRVRARELIKDIARRKQRIALDFHAIGRALKLLSAEPLYVAAGYEAFAALLKGEELFARTTAYKLMAVAEAYPAPQARGLGFEKAYALITYAEAMPGTNLARTLAAENPQIGNRRLMTMSVRDLLEATRRARRAAGGRNVPEAEREALKVARAVQKKLRAKGAKSAKAKAKRVGGKWQVRVDVAVREAELLG